MSMQTFINFLSICSFVIAVTVYTRDQHYKVAKAQDLQNTLARNRRNIDVIDDDVSKSFQSIDNFRKFIQEETNDTLQREARNILEDILKNLPLNELCVVANNRCPTVSEPIGPQGPKRDPGPPGPPGPIGLPGQRGPKGDRGFGLFTPKVIQHTTNVTVNETGTAKIICKVFGNPIPSITWKTHAIHTNISVELVYEKSETTSVLTISKISWSDRGSLSCHANNILGSANATTSLDVQVSPIITMESGPWYTYLGLDVKLPNCNAVSNPKATITWHRLYRALPKGSVLNGDELTITDVQTEDEGLYICTAENQLGKTSKEIQLKTMNLRFIKKPPFYITTSNASLTLTCAAHTFTNGDSFDVTWYILDSNYIPSRLSGIKILKSDGYISGEIEVKSSGRYECQISYVKQKIETPVTVEFFKPMLKLNSILLNNDDISLLHKWLSEVNATGDYNLCYSSERDGKSAVQFYKLCEGKKNIISLMKDGNYVVGGFSDKNWSKDANLFELSSRYAFIFSIYDKRKVSILGQSRALCAPPDSCFRGSRLNVRRADSDFRYITCRLGSQNYNSVIGCYAHGLFAPRLAVEVFYKV